MQSDKFQGADFKHDNIIFKFQSKNTWITHFWTQILGFLFRPNFALNKFEGVNFQYDNGAFKFQPKILKYEIVFKNSLKKFFHYSIGKIFFRKTETVIWGCPVKKVGVSRKIHQKAPVLESFLLVKYRIETYNFIKKRLWNRCFLVNFAKKILRKSSIPIFDWILIHLSLWQVLVGKVNRW